MKFGFVRAIAYAAVVFLAAIALSYVPQLPDSRPADIFVTQAAAPSWKMRFDTLAGGETLQKVLRRGGLSDTAAVRVIQAATTLDERRIPAGMPITIRTDAADSAPSEVIFQLAVDKVIRLKRTGADWSGAEEKLPWTIDTILVSGTIQSNVYAAIDESAANFLPEKARTQLTYALADVYEYKIDMTRELQKGDVFKVIAERQTGSNGVVRIGKVLSASFTLSGTELKAVYFPSTKVSGEYFDEEGKSMTAAFRRYPVEFRRISSNFGSRKHPVLGYTRAHKGTDFAANSGTPVMAIGDGLVVSAGWGNGYGNMIQIRHPNGYVTRYGHMTGFAKGVHSGSHVKMGQTIGYVGMTGLATGPHLHFEVLIAGEQRDPRYAFARKSGDPIPSTERLAFLNISTKLLPRLAFLGRDQATTLAAMASPH